MKKIFAIALAAVMVLSMASAFASACTTGFDWTVADVTKCGKATVEIVPYVKVADSCGGYTWKVSECAGTVANESVFFAVKLIVDGDIDPEWAEKMVVAVETKNIDVELPTVEVEVGTEENPATVEALPELPDVSELDKDTVYYLGVTEEDGEGWYKVDKKTGITVADDVENADVEPNGFIFKGTALTSNSAEVCVSIVSESGDFEEGTVGKYYVVVDGDDETVDEIAVFASKDDAEAEDGEPIVTYYIENGKVKTQENGKEGCSPYTVAEVEAFFGLDNTVKVTRKLVNKNFGWEYEQEDCFKWTATTAIVDAECVVAIPKTGDASLLAWLF